MTTPYTGSLTGITPQQSVSLNVPTDLDFDNAATFLVALQKGADYLQYLMQRAALRGLMAASNWNTYTSGPTSNLTALVYAGAQWVGVSQWGGTTASSVTSPDGVTWTPHTIGGLGATIPTGIAYSGSLYAAIGALGAIATSPDAVTWTTRTSPNSTGLFGITYGGGLFVAVGGNSNSVVTSPDGITWTSRLATTSNTLRAVAYSGSLFVAVGDSGTIYTSPDGITWTSRTSGTGNNLKGVAFGNGVFVAVGASNTTLSSADGITWTTNSNGATGTLNAVTFAQGVFLVVGSAATSSLVSSDGTTWANAFVPGAGFAAGFGLGRFIVPTSSPNLYTSLVVP